MLRKVTKILFIRLLNFLLLKKSESKVKISLTFSSKKNKILCIFSSFSNKNVIQDYLIHYLDSLKSYGMDIVFVTTSENIQDKEIQKISPFLMKFIHRTNIGYDFGSWKVGLESVDYKDYKKVVFANDSVYGPIFPLKEIFERMTKTEFDMWGITDSYEIQYHIMSYFLVYNQRIIESDLFQNMWNSVNFFKFHIKYLIIQNYELGFSKILMDNGFKIGAYCDYNKLLEYVENSNSDMKINRYVNPTLYYWKELIEQGCPFIKIQLLRDNPTNSDIGDWKDVLEKYNFNTKLIANHLKSL